MSTGYGVDTWCVDALVTGRLVDGARLVAQALYGRLVTPRGTLQGYDDEHNAEESVYGFDVCAYLGAVGYPTALAALPGLIENELAKDDRALTVTAIVAQGVGSNGEISLAISVEVVLRDEGADFTLTLSATAEALAVTGLA